MFAWPFAEPGTVGRSPPSHVLPHEIGHAAFLHFLIPRTVDDEYGGDAPDWLDEMVAIAFEDSVGVANRRADGRRHAERHALIPLRRLLAMTHPEWVAAGPSTGQSPGGNLGVPGSPDTPAYYATVRLLFDYLVARTGNPQVLRDLADAARNKVPIDRWMLARVARFGDGPTLEDLDVAMTAFAIGDPAYRAAGDADLRRSQAR